MVDLNHEFEKKRKWKVWNLNLWMAQITNLTEKNSMEKKIEGKVQQTLTYSTSTLTCSCLLQNCVKTTLPLLSALLWYENDFIYLSFSHIIKISTYKILVIWFITHINDSK